MRFFMAALLVLYIGVCFGLIARRHGKNPWVYGILSVVSPPQSHHARVARLRPLPPGPVEGHHPAPGRVGALASSRRAAPPLASFPFCG
ncbi:MAG TPA: hypothetical protein VNX25_04955 [Verrucomicrobiae bacterium]|nr:hypothetical protein [Verrucomicrobiae bacterium]